MPRPHPAHTQEEGISCHKSKLQKHEVTTKVAEWHLSQTNAEARTSTSIIPLKAGV